MCVNKCNFLSIARQLRYIPAILFAVTNAEIRSAYTIVLWNYVRIVTTMYRRRSEITFRSMFNSWFWLINMMFYDFIFL